MIAYSLLFEFEEIEIDTNFTDLHELISGN